MQNKKISAPSKKKSKKIDPYLFSKNKTDKYISMIQKTMLSVQKYKLLDVISAGEMSLCIKSLELLYEDINKLNYTLKSKLRNHSPVVLTHNALLCITIIKYY